MATANGSVVSTGSGKFKLQVVYEYTDKEIKFTPKIVVSDAFGKKYTATLTYGSKSKTKSGIKAKKTYEFSKLSHKGYSVTISLKINGKTSKVTLESTLKPAAPTISVKRVNDNNHKITVRGRGTATKPANRLVIERQDGYASTENWEEVDTPSISSANRTTSYEVEWNDRNTEASQRYRWRVKAVNSNGSSSYATSSWVYTTAGQSENVSHERISNTTNVVTWRFDTQLADRGIIDRFSIERSVNGGVWTKVGTVSARSGSVSHLSYTDKGCSRNCSYRYRVRGVNNTGSSLDAEPEEGTEETFNTPAAPVSIKANYTATGDVELVLNNTPRTATELEIQVSDDEGSTWSDVDTVDETDEPCTYYKDLNAPVGDDLIYRARNVRTEDLPASDRYSAWRNSNNVLTLMVPDKPTLVQPFNDVPFTLDSDSVRLVWIHNSKDGTEQNGANLKYKINDGSWIEMTVPNPKNSYYDFPIPSSRFSADDVVTWMVSTRGELSTYSEYSDERRFSLKEKPQVSFISPDNGDTIGTLPLELSFNYRSGSGFLASMSLDIIYENDVVATYGIPVGTGQTGQYNYSLSEFMFENGGEYQLKVTVLSSEGLSATDAIGVMIQYVPVRLTHGVTPDADFDEDTGYAFITVSPFESEPDPDDEGIVIVDSEVIESFLYRVVNGERQLVKGGLQKGDIVIDKYAPLNIDFTYELLSSAQNGSIALEIVEYMFESKFWFIYFGNDEIIKTQLNPTGSGSLGRPERELVRYSGRKLPVMYDSEAIEEKFSYTGLVKERDELNAFLRMMKNGAKGIWKSADGDSYDASFTFNWSSSYDTEVRKWNISLDVERIDSEDK